MRRLPLLVLLALLPFVTAQAEDGMRRATYLDMSRAAVVASPGVPSALNTFLPGGRTPARLGWPLPNGSLIVLGLPAQDEIARRLCDVFELDADDLAGGYKLWAWRAKTRSMVIVMGADPAALQAARFEFDASAPTEMMDPEARSLDFKRPNQEASVVVRAGTRHVKPRYRMRALRPQAHLPDIGPLVAGARGNRAWLNYNKVDRRTVTDLRAQGVEPVLVGGPDNVRRFARAQRMGVRHFALVLPKDFDGNEGKAARTMAAALRPGGLAELTVVPRGYSDRLAKTYPPPDLRSIPEAVIAWSGPEEHSVRITRADAERRVREARVPVVLYDTWAEPFNPHEAYLPVRPYGRDADLCEVLDGVVVVGKRGTTPMLESAWAEVEDGPFGPQLLPPLLPPGGADAEGFLTRAAMRIEKEVEETLGLVPWMAPLAEQARASALRIHEGETAIAVPIVPSQVVLDGRIDEPAWGFACRIPTDRKDASLLALSDGHSLFFAVRLDKAGDTKTTTIGFGIVDAEAVHICGGGLSSGSVVCSFNGEERTAHARAVHHDAKTYDSAEFVLDRFALGGDAHALRTFDFGVGDVSLLLVVTR